MDNESYYSPSYGPDYGSAAQTVAGMANYMAQAQAVGRSSQADLASVAMQGSQNMLAFALENRKLELANEESRRQDRRESMKLAMDAFQQERAARREELTAALTLTKMQSELAMQEYTLRTAQEKHKLQISAMEEDLLAQQRVNLGKEAAKLAHEDLSKARMSLVSNDPVGFLLHYSKANKVPNIGYSAEATDEIAKLATDMATYKLTTNGGRELSLGQLASDMGGRLDDEKTVESMGVMLQSSSLPAHDVALKIAELNGKAGDGTYIAMVEGIAKRAPRAPTSDELEEREFNKGLIREFQAKRLEANGGDVFLTKMEVDEFKYALDSESTKGPIDIASLETASQNLVSGLKSELVSYAANAVNKQKIAQMNAISSKLVAQASSLSPTAQIAMNDNLFTEEEMRTGIPSSGRTITPSEKAVLSELNKYYSRVSSQSALSAAETVSYLANQSNDLDKKATKLFEAAARAKTAASKVYDVANVTGADVKEYNEAIADWNTIARTEFKAMTAAEPTYYADKYYMRYLNTYLTRKGLALTGNSATVSEGSQSSVLNALKTSQGTASKMTSFMPSSM